MEINVNEMIEINGVKQFIAVRAKHAGNPLLLYVHGGPGDAALPLVLKYNGVLAEHYTLSGNSGELVSLIIRLLKQ